MKKKFTKSLVLIVAMVLIHQFMQHETRACNVAVVTAEASATGRPFIWKNRDHADSYKIEVQYFPEVVTGVGGSMRLLGETMFDSGTQVCTGGANESGFAIANTTCWESIALEITNVNTELMEVALEECQTITEFEQICSEFTDRWSGKNISGIFAVIDAHNGAAIYEMWTNGNGNDIIYRKFDAHTGNVTDENGDSFTDYIYTQTVGFNNRTNSNHTNGWIGDSNDPEMWSDDPREVRARQLMTEMLANDELSPRNMMRRVSKDVCGGNPADYCTGEGVSEKVIDSANAWNDSDDSYLNPNRDGEMYTRYCISRYQTNMGLVIEGAATTAQANLTTMWVSLGEPSLSVFLPFFPAAGQVSKYAVDDTHTNEGYYWNGTSSSSDNEANSFLNLLFDCVESNPFGSSNSLYTTYENMELYKNNGSGNFYDSQDRNNGEYYSYLTLTRKMDTTINYPRLMSLQTWSLPLEDNVFDRTEEFLSVLRSNTDLVDSEELADFSNYCNRYVYENYSHQSDEYSLWSYTLPDNGVPPAVSSINIGDGTDFPLSGTISVTFSEPMNEDSINSETFTIRIGSTKINGNVVYDSDSRTATFIPTNALRCGTTYTVTLTDDIEDLSGSAMSGVYSDTFTTVDCGGTHEGHPTITSSNPVDGSSNFPITGNISVRFSEAMDGGTISEDTFELFNGDVKINGTVTYYPSTHTAMLNPYANLLPDTEYTIELSSSITDEAGNGLEGARSWTFTTAKGGASLDKTPPTILSSSPLDGATDVPVAGNITVQFSEAMNLTTINEETLVLNDSLDQVVAVDLTYDSSTNTVTMDPRENLNTLAGYTVEVADSVSDVAGNALEDAKLWSFTTSDGTDDPDDPTDPGTTQKSNSGDDGCGSAAEASTFAGGTRPVMPGVMSLVVTMLFPLSLMMLHRRARRRNRA